MTRRHRCTACGLDLTPTPRQIEALKRWGNPLRRPPCLETENGVHVIAASDFHPGLDLRIARPAESANSQRETTERRSAMRLAYADPPYPGCAHLYPENAEVDHVALVAKLRTYDGWALSTNENALQYVLSLCPPGVRVLAWCKTNAAPFFSHPFPSWEPVVCVPARSDLPTVRIAAHLATPHPGGFIDSEAGPFPGIKPPAFCEWIIRCLAAERGDSLDDLFPGTGSMGRAWAAYQAQPALWDQPTGGSRSRRERIRSAQLGPGMLDEDVA